MKTMKKLALYLLIPALLTACGTRHPYDNPDELGVIYEGENQRVVQVRPLTPEEMATKPVFTSASYGPFFDESLYDGFIDFAAVGKISNIREMRVDFYDNSIDKKNFKYCTLFDLKIDRIYYIKEIEELKPGETITIYSGHSSYDMDETLIPILKEGDEYLMFLELVSEIMEDGWAYDLTPISKYAITSATHELFRKNGDYLEVWHWLNDEFNDYDSERISKKEAYGINEDNSNYPECGYFFGMNPISGGTEPYPPREAVLRGETYRRLFLEYMQENPETDIGIDIEITDPEQLFWYIDNLPKDIEQQLFDKTMELYTFPDKLPGEYDYEKGLRVEYEGKWYEERGFGGIADHYLYNAEAFERGIQERIVKYKDSNGQALEKRRNEWLEERKEINEMEAAEHED
ncbi:MAG: DUF1835 domain-containing protein [Oscillospiraceae bacterium]|nr:DUF1835 domain-containing protein [Oscillospiraceae bacterium]